MNLTTLRLRIQRTVGLATNSAGDEQTLVDGWLNEAIEQFLVETKCTKKTANLALTADKGDYEIDTDILSFEDPWMDPGDGSQDYMLKPVDSYEIRQLRLGVSSVVGPPYLYSFEGNRLLMLYPNPAASTDKIHIGYVPRPTALLVTGTDDPSTTAIGEIPKEWHHVLEAYAKWKAAEYSSDGPSQAGEKYRAEWERGVAKARIHFNRKAGMRGRRAVVGNNRRFRTVLGNGVDQGN